MNELLRKLPSVHELQNDELFLAIQQKTNLDKETITKLVQSQLQEIRDLILQGEWGELNPSTNEFKRIFFGSVLEKAEHYGSYLLRKIINATGTILHTNLGRARLSDEAIDHVITVAKHYSNLEYRIDEGVRGSRHDILENMLTQLTGAEAAIVVNNNAAAVYFILRALAKDCEVIVSRGQLVEIGGSFRISSIMEESGAHLVEVGTTNKTHLTDYEEAINEKTKMILKVHTSNFKTIGFTKTVPSDELIHLSNKHEHLIFYEDLGSGVLFDFSQHGIGEEPVVNEVLKLGADIVSFSGDKLLGGPQAGIIAGKKALINKLKKHQLARVLRVDKLTYAALEATLSLYLRGKEQRIPVVRDMLLSSNIIKVKAESFISQISHLAFTASLEKDISQIGGGTMPDVNLETYVVALKHQTKNAETISKELRMSTPSIITRIKNDKVIFDLRTISDFEVNEIIDVLAIVQ